LARLIQIICDKAKVDDKTGQVTVADTMSTKTPKGCCCVAQLGKSRHIWNVYGIIMDFPPDKEHAPWTTPELNEDGQSSKEGFLISPHGKNGKPGPGSGGLIHTPVLDGSTGFFAYDPKGNLIAYPFWRVFAHELCGHAMHLDSGTHWHVFPGHTGRSGDRPFHDQAIIEENDIAIEHGLPKRGLYGENEHHGESVFRKKEKK